MGCGFREISKGFWRNVISANAEYEILLVTKGWGRNNTPNNKYYVYYCVEDNNNIGLYRELIGITFTYEQAENLVERDYEEGVNVK